MSSVEFSAKFELIFLFYIKDEIKAVRIEATKACINVRLGAEDEPMKIAP
jgi:hypothetical protein